MFLGFPRKLSFIQDLIRNIDQNIENNINQNLGNNIGHNLDQNMAKELLIMMVKYPQMILLCISNFPYHN